MAENDNEVAIDTDDPASIQTALVQLASLLSTPDLQAAINALTEQLPLDRKVWAVTLDGVQTAVHDLTYDVLQKIADDNNVLFTTVVDLPHMRGQILAEVVQAIAKKRGISLTLELTARNLRDVYDLVDDDLPDRPPAVVVEEGDAAADPTGGGTSTLS